MPNLVPSLPFATLLVNFRNNMKPNSYFEKLSERKMSIAEGRNLKYLNEDLITYCKGELNSPWP
jgi:hypothetical protein